VSRNRTKHKEFYHGQSAILSAVALAEVEASATAEWTRSFAALVAPKSDEGGKRHKSAEQQNELEQKGTKETKIFSFPVRQSLG
jgi:hypothetical protein